MKSSSIILTVILTLATVSVGKAAEADGKAARKPGAGERPGAGRFGAGLEGLDLTEDQKSKVHEFMRESGEQLRALRDDQGTPREEKVKKFQEFQEKTAAKLKEVLTKEQYEKWEKQRGGAPAAGGFSGNRERIQKVMEELDLSAEQKEKVRAAMQEQGQTLQGLRDASPDERREKFQKIQESMSAKMKEILTNEQFEKWEKSRAELGGRLGDGGPGRKKPE